MFTKSTMNVIEEDSIDNHLNADRTVFSFYMFIQNNRSHRAREIFSQVYKLI